MKIKNQIIDIEDRVLLSQYLLSLGYQCGMSEGNLSVYTDELPSVLIKRLTNMTPAKLKSLKFYKDQEIEKELQKQMDTEDKKIKLERVRDKINQSQAIKDLAIKKLTELEE